MIGLLPIVGVFSVRVMQNADPGLLRYSTFISAALLIGGAYWASGRLISNSVVGR